MPNIVINQSSDPKIESKQKLDSQINQSQLSSVVQTTEANKSNISRKIAEEGDFSTAKEYMTYIQGLDAEESPLKSQHVENYYINKKKFKLHMNEG
jgi:hypothetical protein